MIETSRKKKVKIETHILLVILQTITRLADSLEKKCINPVLAHNKEEKKKHSPQTAMPK